MTVLIMGLGAFYNAVHGYHVSFGRLKKSAYTLLVIEVCGVAV